MFTLCVLGGHKTSMGKDAGGTGCFIELSGELTHIHTGKTGGIPEIP